MDTVNIFSAENTEGRIDVARATGSTATAMFIYDVDPGEGSSPYHYESEEEWLLVIEGTVVVRTPDGEQSLERGDLVRFPAGPAGAHKVMNRSNSSARTLLFSRFAGPGHLRLPGQRHDRRLGRRGERPRLRARHRRAVGARRGGLEQGRLINAAGCIEVVEQSTGGETTFGGCDRFDVRTLGRYTYATSTPR